MNISTLRAALIMDTSQFQMSLGTADAAYMRSMRRMHAGNRYLISSGATGLAAITAPAIAAGKAVMDVYGNYELLMSKMKSVGGKSQSEMMALDTYFKKVSVNLGATVSEMANVGYTAVQSMYSTNAEIKKIAETTAKLKVASGWEIDMAKAADDLLGFTRAFDLPISKIEEMSDVWLKSRDVGRIALSELGTELGKTASIASTLYSNKMQGFKESLAIIAVLSNAGLPKGTLGISVRNMIQQAISADTKKNKLMHQFAVDKGFGSSAEMFREVGLLDFFRALTDASGSHIELLQDLGMMSRSMSGAAAFGTVGEREKAIKEVMENAKGAMDAYFRENSTVWEFTKEQFKATGDLLANQWGPALKEHISTLTQGTVSFVNAMAAIPESFKHVALMLGTMFTMFMGVRMIRGGSRMLAMDKGARTAGRKGITEVLQAGITKDAFAREQIAVAVAKSQEATTATGSRRDAIAGMSRELTKRNQAANKALEAAQNVLTGKLKARAATAEKLADAQRYRDFVKNFSLTSSGKLGNSTILSLRNALNDTSRDIRKYEQLLAKQTAKNASPQEIAETVARLKNVRGLNKGYQKSFELALKTSAKTGITGTSEMSLAEKRVVDLKKALGNLDDAHAVATKSVDAAAKRVSWLSKVANRIGRMRAAIPAAPTVDVAALEAKIGVDRAARRAARVALRPTSLFGISKVPGYVRHADLLFRNAGKMAEVFPALTRTFNILMRVGKAARGFIVFEFLAQLLGSIKKRMEKDTNVKVFDVFKEIFDRLLKLLGAVSDGLSTLTDIIVDAFARMGAGFASIVEKVTTKEGRKEASRNIAERTVESFTDPKQLAMRVFGGKWASTFLDAKNLFGGAADRTGALRRQYQYMGKTDREGGNMRMEFLKMYEEGTLAAKRKHYEKFLKIAEEKNVTAEIAKYKERIAVLDEVTMAAEGKGLSAGSSSIQEYAKERMKKGLDDMTNTIFGFKDEGNDGKKPNESPTVQGDPTLVKGPGEPTQADFDNMMYNALRGAFQSIATSAEKVMFEGPANFLRSGDFFSTRSIGSKQLDALSDPESIRKLAKLKAELPAIEEQVSIWEGKAKSRKPGFDFGGASGILEEWKTALEYTTAQIKELEAKTKTPFAGMPTGKGLSNEEFSKAYNELVQKQAAATGDEAQAWKGAIDILTTYRDIMYEQQDLVQERKDMMGDDSWKAAQAIDAKSVEGMNAMLGYRDNDSKTFKEIASKVKDLDRKFQDYQMKFSQFMAEQNKFWAIDIATTKETAKALK
jgi:hypothetical protein